MATDNQFYDDVMLMLPECIKKYHQYLSDKENNSSTALRAECTKEMDKFYKNLRVSSDEVSPLSMEFFIMYAQYSIERKTVGTANQLVQFNRLHNQAKYYIHKIIKNELKGNSQQSSMPIHDYAESQYLLERSHGVQLMDKESYLARKREEIYAEIQKNFLNNRETYLVEYFFFKSFTPRLQISYYLNDLSWFLIKNFGNILSSKESIITKYPSMHIEYGTFSPSSASMQPNKLHKEENRTGDESSEKLYYERPSAEGNSNTKVYITNAASVPQTLEGSTELDEVLVNKAVSEMFLGSDGWKMASLPLDARDLTLLVFEYNLISPKVIKEFRIHTTLKDATKFLYPNYKKLTRREYEDTLKRIIKINHYIINATKEKEDGTLEIVNLPLYASKVTLTPKDKQQRNITSTNNLSSVNFEDYNLFDATIEFYPSAAQLQAWQDGANGIILTEKYKEITEFSSKQLLLVFQSERLDMFPETKRKYPFSFFMEHMNAVNMKLNIFKRKLLGMLDTLSNYDVINYYEIDPLGIDFGITISFCEFSDIEKKAYNLYSEQDSEKELNSRIVAEQIDGQLFIPL